MLITNNKEHLRSYHDIMRLWKIGIFTDKAKDKYLNKLYARVMLAETATDKEQ
jgi:hypothetical protein